MTPKPALRGATTGSENQVKITMDGDRLQVAANVDAKAAQRLLKAIQANLALSGDDADE